VAHNYHRVLAVKDEWEVARLYSHPDFQAGLQREFEGDYTLRFHIGAWPFGHSNAKSVKSGKAELGPWLLTALRWMARLRGLRGGWLDPFRNSAERALDRQLLKQYEADVERILAELSRATQPVAVKLAALPESVRGYGHVKQSQADIAAQTRSKLWVEFEMAGVVRNVAA
jgi:indolepyruvate ferredoxin oxidoreductase